MKVQAPRLAFIAHIRHKETNYDGLLGKGWERSDARSAVADRVHEVLKQWEAEIRSSKLGILSRVSIPEVVLRY